MGKEVEIITGEGRLGLIRRVSFREVKIKRRKCILDYSRNKITLVYSCDRKR